MYQAHIASSTFDCTEGSIPIMPLSRNAKSMVTLPAYDPLWDIDALPLTYSASKRYSFLLEAEKEAIEKCLPSCCVLNSTVVELWYAVHNKSKLGPHTEMGITVSASCEGVHFGYTPFSYVTQDAAMDYFRLQGFPHKKAYIRTLEHGSVYQNQKLNGMDDYFSFLITRNGYLLHTATGKFSDSLLDLDSLDYGISRAQANLKISTNCDLSNTVWQLVYRPQIKDGEDYCLYRDTIRTSKAEDINWLFNATPFDSMAHYLPFKKLIGMVSYCYDAKLPLAKTIWMKKVARTKDDIEKYCMYGIPYENGMRSQYPVCYGI